MTMDLPCRQDGVTLSAGLMFWEAVLRLSVNPQVAFGFGREVALWTLPQLIVAKLILTAIRGCLSLFVLPLTLF